MPVLVVLGDEFTGSSLGSKLDFGVLVLHLKRVAGLPNVEAEGLGFVADLLHFIYPGCHRDFSLGFHEVG